MKRSLVFVIALASAGLCAAQEEGLMISSKPVSQPVAAPRMVCTNTPVAVQPPKSGAGAVVGAIAGGVVGSAATRGSGAGAVIGAIGGAMIGDRVEEAPAPVMSNAQSCAMQTTYENRIVGYDVEYEYGGKRYRTQLPYEPGQTIALRVAPDQLDNPNAAPPQPIVNAPAPVYTPPIVVSQPAVMAPAPMVYPAPYPYYYPAPVGVQLRLGYWGGYPYHYYYGPHHGHR